MAEQRRAETRRRGRRPSLEPRSPRLPWVPEAAASWGSRLGPAAVEPRKPCSESHEGRLQAWAGGPSGERCGAASPEELPGRRVPLGRGRRLRARDQKGRGRVVGAHIYPFGAHRIGLGRGLEVRPKVGTRTPGARRGARREVSGGLGARVVMTTPHFSAALAPAGSGLPTRPFLVAPPGGHLPAGEKRSLFAGGDF